MKPKLAVQLWSVKEEAKKDFIRTLEVVKKMGYDGVELAGYDDITSYDLKKELDRIGLEVCGAHIGLDEITNNLDKVIEYSKEIGNKYIICPWADVSTKQKCLDLNEQFKLIDKKVRENSMIFGYHNHAGEFDTYDGKYAFDYLLEDTQMIYELDVFWSEYAGIDTIQYLRKIGGQGPLVHLKDMKLRDDKTKGSAPYGAGILDSKAFVDAAKENKTEWLIIEWEEDDMDCFEAVRISVDNLKKML